MKVIKQIFNTSNQTYDSPRITTVLKKQGYLASKPRVTKLMRKHRLRSKIRKKYKMTTNSKHNYLVWAILILYFQVLLMC